MNVLRATGTAAASVLEQHCSSIQDPLSLTLHVYGEVMAIADVVAARVGGNPQATYWSA